MSNKIFVLFRTAKNSKFNLIASWASDGKKSPAWQENLPAPAIGQDVFCTQTEILFLAITSVNKITLYSFFTCDTKST